MSEFTARTGNNLGTETTFLVLRPSRSPAQSTTETRVPEMSTIQTPGTDITTDVPTDAEFPVLAAAGGAVGAGVALIVIVLILIVVVIFVMRTKRRRKTINIRQDEQMMNNPVYSGMKC